MVVLVPGVDALLKGESCLEPEVSRARKLKRERAWPTRALQPHDILPFDLTTFNLVHWTEPGLNIVDVVRCYIPMPLWPRQNR